MSKAKQIVDEVREKVLEYEIAQASFMRSVGEWGDLFRVRPPTRTGNQFSNPRLSEMFRAGNALGTMMYRMQTASDPFFEVVPIWPSYGSDRALVVQAMLETQLQHSQYRRHLLNANVGTCVFGTQIVQEDYTLIGINRFGRKLPVTTFRPRSLLQVAFERSTLDIEDADWITTEDLISDAGLMELGREVDEIDAPWNKKVLEFAAKEKMKAAEISQHFLNRLQSVGMVSSSQEVLRKGLLMYQGKLDCMNDGIDYVCGVVNRRHLVRFHPNQDQSGRRNFRVGRWIEDPLTLDPIALGLGSLLGNLHKSMDANRQRATDNITMASYGMWERRRSAGINDDDLKIRPLNIVDTDESGGFKQLDVNVEGAKAALTLEELLRAEFKSASGATDTLQAIMTDGTATEAALVQNEALRNISVKAEMIAEAFVRDHLVVSHANNVMHLNAPVNVNTQGIPRTIYPADLRLDCDFKLKIVSDKDFKPKRLESMLTALQIITSTKSQNPALSNANVKPIIDEILRALNIPAESVFEAQQQGGGLPPELMALMGGQMGSPSPQSIPNLTGLPEGGNTSTLQTPMGPVAGSVPL